MVWPILFHEEFADEFREWSHETQRSAANVIAALELVGPTLGRPQVDTLQGSKHRNMKELRFVTQDGAWRIAFAFDPARQAILLAGGNKAVWPAAVSIVAWSRPPTNGSMPISGLEVESKER
jgi:hypothetical protein